MVIKMTGTIINAGAIVAAGLLGLLLRRGIPEKISYSVQNGLGLVVLIIGLQYAIKADNLVAIGLSLAIGAFLGELWGWEQKLENLGERLLKLFKDQESPFAKGFVSSSLLFCVGAMAVVGALEDGLNGNYHILLIKSILNGIFSFLFSASMGVGVIFSAVPVLLYQGSISLASGLISPYITDAMLNGINSLGGILITGLSFNLLHITHMRIANFLPSLLIMPFIIIFLDHIHL
jgi:uncharacterized membrane protein YqgA involved in biofilm formation